MSLCRESNAILLYLIGKYDKENKFGVTDEKDKATLLQWLFFQASGQGRVSAICLPFTNPINVRLSVLTLGNTFGSLCIIPRRSPARSSGTRMRYCAFSESLRVYSRSSNGSSVTSTRSLIYPSSRKSIHVFPIMGCSRNNLRSLADGTTASSKPSRTVTRSGVLQISSLQLRSKHDRHSD